MMNPKGIGAGVMGISILVLFYALFIKAVTVPVTFLGETVEVVNVHLLSQRQNLIMVGALGVVCGLLLFLFGAQMAADEDADEDSQPSRLEQASEQFNEWFESNIATPSGVVGCAIFAAAVIYFWNPIWIIFVGAPVAMAAKFAVKALVEDSDSD